MPSARCLVHPSKLGGETGRFHVVSWVWWWWKYDAPVPLSRCSVHPAGRQPRSFEEEPGLIDRRVRLVAAGGTDHPAGSVAFEGSTVRVLEAGAGSAAVSISTESAVARRPVVVDVVACPNIGFVFTLSC